MAIQKLKNGRGAVARFGEGTVRIKPYTLQTRFGGQIELTQCRKKKTGEPVTQEDVVPNSNKIVLDFASIESVDVLIEKLQALREDMANEYR